MTAGEPEAVPARPINVTDTLLAGVTLEPVAKEWDGTQAVTEIYSTHYRSLVRLAVLLVRDVATAAGLSAFGFVLGPFVYLGHEKLWDYYGSPSERTLDPPTPTNLLPAPA